ncbi:MAG: cytochrome c3 family protein [Pseudomonadota bacterium]
MKKLGILLAIAALACIAYSFAIAAGNEPETVKMESKVYSAHTKAVVTFTHAKHSADYKLACTECHHVYADGKNTWKQGDAVQKCEACHPKSDKPKQGATKEEQIQSHQWTLHENCKGCHQTQKKGPTKCTECHAAEK